MQKPQYLTLKGFLAFQILHELNKKKLCGDDLANIIGGKKGAKLTPGTIYPALKFLRKRKLVSCKRYGRKKLYILTEPGKREYRVYRRAFKRIFKEVLGKN